MVPFRYEYGTANDRRVTTRYPGETVTVTRAYDAAHWLTNAAVWVNGSQRWAFSYEFDAAGRLVKRRDGDGSWRNFGYDAQDNVTSSSWSEAPNGAAGAAWSFGYQYDQGGNRVREARDGSIGIP
jgi:YD repeat-containing protein